MQSNTSSDGSLNRRRFIQNSAVGIATLPLVTKGQVLDGSKVASYDFQGKDSWFHGHGWQSLNPGYWQIRNGMLRRRLSNYGDRARSTGFPYHYETHGRNGGVMNVDYDPSLPVGVLYRQDWFMESDYAVKAEFQYHGRYQDSRSSQSADWKMHQAGYGLMGLAFGAESLFESYHKTRNVSFLSWSDDGRLAFSGNQLKKGGSNPEGRVSAGVNLKPGETVTIHLSVKFTDNGKATLDGTLEKGGKEVGKVKQEVPAPIARGYLGVSGRGLLDFSLRRFEVRPELNQLRSVGEIDCHVCYPLGDSLIKEGNRWTVRFVGLFASDGELAEIRISDSENPVSGWNEVPVAGRAKIVNHRWRRNTASIPVTLPFDPSEKTMFYTVWKDGKNVTHDLRIGTEATGEGTGYVGDVPTSGRYVGRLPRLAAPYKICGLSCHALTSGLQKREGDGFKMVGGGNAWQFRDQPTVEAYKHLDEYDFQIMCWEDDVWYMELMFYPPSTDDAYKVVTMSIAGPTTRWQMMRHWNVINPGDHDYGMDDVKGPEQIAIRLKDGLGQDKDYMRRNFQIVHHLITGEEEVDPIANPKKWRAWKMPNRDFTFAIVDSRLWRSSQDTAMWDDEGWGHLRELYDRADPTRSLLGEEQFAWLQELIRTDSSPLICLTGLNGLHTVWTGGKGYSRTEDDFAQRDRVAADYAGWVAAGSDRVIELLGSRDGVVSVYGDVHNGCLMRNRDHGLYECSFGPIGRSGGRSVIEGFGPEMKDYDGRPVEVQALYHKTHADPTLNSHEPNQPFYWNFLEMEFDPRKKTQAIGFRIRNMIDHPTSEPRGGGHVATGLATTGRPPTCTVPAIKVIPNADVRFSFLNGAPIRGTRSDEQGHILTRGLIGPKPGDRIMITAQDGENADARIVTVEG